ncbi:MAG: sigma-70 family RNA polymerase sigma factor [Bacteroidales bacterium]|nr:sigma-70 family RNA polymerase sigma factor [Bacteroidales bacterium]
MTENTLPINPSLYREYASKAVYGYCYSKFGNFLTAEDYEDIISDTVLKMWKYRDSYDPSKAEPATWVGTIARNLLFTYADRKKRSKAIFGECPTDESGHCLVEAVGDLDSDRDLNYRDSFESFESCLSKDREVEILRLRVEGYDTESIADICGLSVKQVYALWHKLKGKLSHAA